MLQNPSSENRMIGKAQIESNLVELDTAFGANPQYSLYFSKLAILELCGWTELCMDEIVRKHAARKRLNSKNNKYLEKKVIERTFGFQYEDHFRAMLMRLLGLVGLERLERLVDPVLHTKMTAQLVSLKSVRNTLAHTFLQLGTLTIDAPSLTISRLHDLHAGLAEYDAKLNAM